MHKHTKFSLLVLLYIGIVSSKSLLSKGQTIERFAYLSSYEDESEFLRAGNCNSNKIIQYQIKPNASYIEIIKYFKALHCLISLLILEKTRN